MLFHKLMPNLRSDLRPLLLMFTHMNPAHENYCLLILKCNICEVLQNLSMHFLFALRY
jgi:hypothetical protein